MERIVTPPPRKAHGAVVDGDGNLWIVGGATRNTNSFFRRLNDVWMWNTKKAQWTELQSEGLVERQEHQVYIWRNTLMVVSGGTGASSIIKPPLVQIYDQGSNRWHTIKVENEDMIPAKSQSALIEDRLYFVGGLSPLGTHYSTDCFCLDLTTCKVWKLQTSGNIPSSRYSEICAVKNKIYMFSGISSTSYVTDDKLYALDINTLKWSVVETTGSAPTPRFYHSMTAYKKKLFVFGGQGYNDLFEFDTKRRVWTQIATTGETPTERMCSTICVTEKFVFLFGGGANATDFGCDELLVLNRESKQWSRVSGKELAYVAAPTDHLDVGLVLGDVTQQIAAGTQNDRISFKVKLMLSEGGLPPQEEKLDLLKIVFGDNNPFTTYTPFADVKPPSDPPPPYSPYPNQYSS